MPKRGFSLIEILVSASLLAITGAMLLQSLSSSLDAKDAVESTSGRYHLVRSAMSRMVDEISMAYLSKHQALTEARTKTGFLGERDSLKFTAFGYVPRVADEKKSDQRQLAYYLDTDPRTQTESLFRREQANIDDNFEEGGRPLVLLPNVRELTFEYWDPQKEEWTEKWDAAGAEHTGQLPTRVRIKLIAVMDDGIEQTFTTQTKVWLLKPLDF
jgi:prepilin-type N-terminal cleavage/methylation domain-containing protein